MSKLKNYLCGLLAVLLVIGSVACATADSPTDTSAPPTTPPATSSATEPSPSPDSEQVDSGEPLVAVLIPGPVGYFQAVRAGMDRAAESYGLALEYLDAGWDAARQLSQIEDSIARGVDMIAVCAVDADAIVSGIEMANDAGVPIIAFTNAIGEDPSGAFEGLVSYVGQSEVNTGALCGRIAIDMLGPDGGRVVLLEGRPGTFPQRYRREGFLGAILSSPNIEVVFTQTTNWEMGEGMRIIEDLIQSGLEFDLVFAQDDNSSIGAGIALEDANLKDSVFVIGLGGSIDGLQALRDGTIDATTFMSAEEEGFLTIETIFNYFSGKAVGPVTELVQAEVNRGNADSFVGEW